MDRMEQARGHRSFGPLLALAILLVMAAVYVAGYYGSCTAVATTMTGRRLRVYESPWQTRLFTAAAAVESWVIGGEVSLADRGQLEG